MPLANKAEGKTLNRASPAINVPLGRCRSEIWPGACPGVAIQLQIAKRASEQRAGRGGRV